MKVRFVGENEYRNVEISKDNKRFIIDATMLDKLEEVVVPEGITNISYPFVFDKAKNLKKVTLPNTLKELGGKAFGSCKQLEEITIPESVERIRMYAFHHCTRLKRVFIPHDRVVIECGAFQDCSVRLGEVYNNCRYIGTLDNPYNWAIGIIRSNDIPETCHHLLNVFDCTMKEIIIPNQVKTVFSHLCSRSQASKIIIGKNVEGDISLDHCDNLKDLVINSPKIKIIDLYASYHLNLCITKKAYELNKDILEGRVDKLEFMD